MFICLNAFLDNGKLDVGEFLSGKLYEELILVMTEAICMVAKEVAESACSPSIDEVSPPLLGEFCTCLRS